MLENMGLRVIGETPYQVRTPSGEIFWILDFYMLLPKYFCKICWVLTRSAVL